NSSGALTVPAYFAGLQGNIDGMPWPQVAAGALIFVAPVVLFTIAGRRPPLRGLTFGAVQQAAPGAPPGGPPAPPAPPPIPRASLAGMAAGLALELQPFVDGGLRAGFLVLLVSVVLQIVSSHAAAAAGEATAANAAGEATAANAAGEATAANAAGKE